MPDLASEFAAAADRVQLLPEKPDNAALLRLYALYKQGSTGDVSGKRPGMTDFVGRAKYDAWASLQGMPPDEAMRGYIDAVDELEAAAG